MIVAKRIWRLSDCSVVLAGRHRAWARLPVCAALAFAAGPLAAQGAPEQQDTGMPRAGVRTDLLAAAGTSTATDDEVPGIQGGAHDPKRRGFTLQQLELGLFGSYSPFAGDDSTLTGAAFATLTEEIVELEEAFARLDCPRDGYGFEFEAGYFFTEFGLTNPRHPHAWEWLDQPVVLTRMFGGEGMRGLGARAAAGVQAPWSMILHLGVQNAFSETMSSFGGGFEAGHGHGGGEEEDAAGVGGRPLIERERRSFADFVWLARWENSVKACDSIDIGWGFSGLFGPNATGISGETAITGADLSLLMRRGAREAGKAAPMLLDWTSEALYRRYKADAFVDEGDPLDAADDIALPADDLNDWGVVTQVRYWLDDDWLAGLRFEYARGSGQNFHDEDGALGPLAEDTLRDARTRISPMIQWQPSETLRVRLQYNYDHTEHLEDGEAYSIWLGIELILGAHGH